MFIFILTSIFIIGHIFCAYRIKTLDRRCLQTGQTVKEYKEMSLLIPCYNEAVIIRSSIQSLTQQIYPNLEIVFINDGSEDQTMEILKQELELKALPPQEEILMSKKVTATYQSNKYKNMFVIDKENGGKADSLNAGINFTNKEYVVTLDADSILKEDALFEINYSLQDEDVIALGGNVIVAQGVNNFNGKVIKGKLKGRMIERVQFIEYLRGFFVLKNALAGLNALTVISGAFGIFNRKIMLELEGFKDTVGEDIDITIRFNQYADLNGKKMLYNDRALCFTEVPNNWSDVKKQRVRWQKAFLDALKNHRGYLFKYMGIKPLAFFMIIESFLLMYLSTVFTIVGSIYLGIDVLRGNELSPIIYYLLLIGIFIFVTYNIITFKLAKQGNICLKEIGCYKLLSLLIYEFIWYRPLMITIILYGSVAYCFNPKGWNKVQRIGVTDSFVLTQEENVA